MKWYLFSNHIPANGRPIAIFDLSDGLYWFGRISGDHIKITDDPNWKDPGMFYAEFKLADWIRANGSDVCWSPMTPPTWRRRLLKRQKTGVADGQKEK